MHFRIISCWKKFQVWLFSFDGYDNLMGIQNCTFPIVMYGCVDATSRILVWIKVWDSNSSPYLLALQSRSVEPYHMLSYNQSVQQLGFFSSPRLPKYHFVNKQKITCLLKLLSTPLLFLWQ